MFSFPTETVIFKINTPSGLNSIGETVNTVTEYSIKGCLVDSRASTEGSDGFVGVQGNVVRVHIPKSFKTPLTDGQAIIRGRTFTILAEKFPILGSPLDWDRFVTCEVFR